MKKALILLITAVFALTGAAYAVKVTEDNTYVIIKTDKYEAHWKKAAQMGYMEVFLPGKQNSLIGVGDRAFYHSSNYNGAWRDWGALSKWEIVDQKPGMAVVRYISHDSDSKEYTCTAYYYDSVNYIKHEVVVKNTGKGNLFVIFGEPDIEILPVAGEGVNADTRHQGPGTRHEALGTRHEA